MPISDFADNTSFNDPDVGSTPQEVTAAEVIPQLLNRANGACVVDGPLARAYGDALNEIYKKKVDPVTGIVLESQQMDQANAQLDAARFAVQTGQFCNDGQTGYIYVVDENTTALEDQDKLVTAIAQMSPEQKINSAVVVDSTHTTDENGNPIAQSLEHYARSQGVAVYKGLDELVRRHLMS